MARGGKAKKKVDEFNKRKREAMSSTSGRGRPHSLRKRRPHSLPLHRMNQVHALLMPSFFRPGSILALTVCSLTRRGAVS
jgi:hypothetical protein